MGDPLIHVGGWIFQLATHHHPSRGTSSACAEIALWHKGAVALSALLPLALAAVVLSALLHRILAACGVS